MSTCTMSSSLKAMRLAAWAWIAASPVKLVNAMRLADRSGLLGGVGTRGSLRSLQEIVDPCRTVLDFPPGARQPRIL
jgi:hypothetical protein